MAAHGLGRTGGRARAPARTRARPHARTPARPHARTPARTRTHAHTHAHARARTHASTHTNLLMLKVVLHLQRGGELGIVVVLRAAMQC